MKCKICNNEIPKVCFTAQIMNKHEAEYFHCPNCKFLQIKNPFWVKEAYKEPINASDTGYVLRNINLSKIALSIFLFMFGKNKNYLDYGGGFGMLTRLMRDFGLNFYWSDKYSPNLFSKHFEYSNQKIDAITCIECFEHFESPLTELENMLSISKNVLFSTEMIPNTPPTIDWWYYGLNHGQHISFYSSETLKYIGEKFNLHFITNGCSLHMFTERKINKALFKLLIFCGKNFSFILSELIGTKTMADNQYVISKENHEIFS